MWVDAPLFRTAPKTTQVIRICVFIHGYDIASHNHYGA